MKVDLKLYKLKSGYEGYDSIELGRWLQTHGLAEKWNKWAGGITGAIHEDHFITYKHDVDAFLSGQPNLD